jgi:type VI secretion system protein ImpC
MPRRRSRLPARDAWYNRGSAWQSKEKTGGFRVTPPMDFELQWGRRAGGSRPGEGDATAHVLLVGDFSGRGGRGVLEPLAEPEGRPILSLDVDSLDKRMAQLRPRLRYQPVGGSSPAQEISFASLDDFHPDTLYQKLDLFRALRGLRERMLDASTFAAAASELRPGPSPASSSQGSTSGAGENVDATLERLLGRRPAEAPASRPEGRLDLAGFLRGIVAPYIVPGKDPQQAQFVASIDEATGDQMRALLRDLEVQRLESAWRSVHRLIAALQGGEQVRLHLLDVTRDEIAEDLRRSGGDPVRTGLCRILTEGSRGAGAPRGWTLIAADLSFGPSPEDLDLLAALGAIAARAGGPLIAEGRPDLLGVRSLVDAPDPGAWPRLDPEAASRWRALRRGPAAAWVGLALPRVLLRLPYGAKTDPVERFAFEELADGAGHARFLWGNPAFACAELAGVSFLEAEGVIEPGDHLEVADLPAHTFVDQGESRMTPCAEVYLSERAAEKIMEQGLMSIVSYRDRNAARLIRFQSVADPPAQLSGAWS